MRAGSEVKRYTNIQLPAYKYIPKQSPHPSQISEAVHIPKLKNDLNDFSTHNWNDSTRYLYAIDLFNLGYYWEVHEVLEKLWLELGKKSAEGIFIQGLIQLAVALLKHSQGNSIGVERLSKKAFPRIKSQNGIYIGIDIQRLVREFNSYVSKEQVVPPLIFLKMES